MYVFHVILKFDIDNFAVLTQLVLLRNVPILFSVK